MRTFAQSAVTISMAVAMLAGCGGSQSPISAPAAIPQASALATRTTSTNYKVLYSFGPAPDGSYPIASLIEVNGTLYGTTANGGSPSRCLMPGCGTAFRITTGGTEKVLYSFGPRPDGLYPAAGLIDVRGTLYGTTTQGGSHRRCGRRSDLAGCGTVFSITTGGREKVLHSFSGYPDGVEPWASLIKVNGTLYGTTEYGGAGSSYFGGTVFSITPSGTEKVLHSFDIIRDGIYPLASLVEVKGMLYSTTANGGEYGCDYTIGCGTVFSMTPSGVEKVLHAFGAGTDGVFPEAPLIEVNGTLYGTTPSGGGSYHGGTVFSITLSGTEKVLHVFSGGTDGASPYAPLINVKGTLYGTTQFGGAYNSGTVFSITPSGREKVLHSFGNGTDGNGPTAGLIDVKGTLYGTTGVGGTYGHGTVFALTP